MTNKRKKGITYHHPMPQGYVHLQPEDVFPDPEYAFSDPEEFLRGLKKLTSTLEKLIQESKEADQKEPES